MSKHDNYLYPAVFTYMDGYDICVDFPDFELSTQGETETQALAMAKEALGGRIWCMEEDNEALPQPSLITQIKPTENQRIVLVDVYMPAIRLSETNKSVNRTVTLPAWLNAAALDKGINFSQALQQTLMNELGVRPL